MQHLLDAGALDVHYTPVFMKKNRPAWELAVLCHEEDRQMLEQIIFAETTTIGIRRAYMQRDILPRRKSVVRTVFGDVEVKLCQLGARERCYVEYASAAKIASSQGIPLAEVYQAVQAEQKNTK